MNWIDLAWPMISGACVMLGVIHLVIWLKQTDQPANLAFAIAAVSLAVFAICELMMMRAQTPYAYATVLRWGHIPIATLVLGMIGFFLLRYRAGSRPLAVMAALARIVSLILNFATGENLLFLDIVGLEQFRAWGGGVISIPAADAIPNPWHPADTVADVLLLLFVASVAVDLLRQHASLTRRRALSICCATIVLIVFAQVWNFAIVQFDLRGPLVFSPACLFLLLAMGNGLGSEILRARQLALGLSTAELELVDTRRQMDIAVHAAGVGLWNGNMVSGKAWFSDQSLSILGCRAGDVLDLDGFRARISPADRERFDAALREARDAAGEFRGEYRIAQPGGTSRWIAARGLVEFARDQMPLRVDAAIIDITQRKEAEERFRLVVEKAPAAMLMFDLKGVVVLANAKAVDVFGFSIGELIGSSIDLIVPEQATADRRHRPRLTAGIAAMKMAIGSGCDLSGRRKDGSEVPIKVALNPIPIESKLYMLAAITDLSEKNRLERELAVQRDELAHLSRVALLAELSGSLAHELNQPLTAILANAQGALRFLARDPPDLGEVRACLAHIVESDKRAGEVIRRLRAMLRKDRAEFRQVDVNEVIDGVLKIIRSDLLNRHIETLLELDGGLPMVYADVVQLQQVLLNLIVNASDAMGEGNRREVTLRTSLAATDRVLVSVSDIGHGISGTQLEDIFAPFVSTKRDGLGLGLAVCRTIITAHQGTIWATNNEGPGATVSFSLPVDREPEVAANAGTRNPA